MLLSSKQLQVGEMKKDLRQYELEKASEHITPSPLNEYVLLPLEKKYKASDLQSSGIFSLNRGLMPPNASQQT